MDWQTLLSIALGAMGHLHSELFTFHAQFATLTMAQRMTLSPSLKPA